MTKPLGEYNDYGDWADQNPEEAKAHIEMVVSRYENGIGEDELVKAVVNDWYEMLMNTMEDDGLVTKDDEGRYSITEKGKEFTDE